MKGVLAMLRPLRRDAEVLADGRGRAFNRDATTEFGVHVATFLYIALAFAGTRRSALDNGVDELAANRFGRHGINRQIKFGRHSRKLGQHFARCSATDENPVQQVLFIM